MRTPLVLLGLAGCVGSVAPTPIISVLERDPSGCLALLTPDNPVAGQLQIAEVCPAPAMFPTMLAGVDLIEVVIDYGPDVDFADDTMAPSPAVTLLIDGEVSATPVEISAEQRVGSRAYFIATFRAPPTPSNNLRILAGVGPGFETEVPTVFSVQPPPVALGVMECPTGVCEIAAAVGEVHVHVGLPGDVSLPVQIHQTIDGHVEADPTAPIATILGQGGTAADVAIPVPAARPGALWVLSAQVNTSESASIVLMLDAPVITASLSCGATCALAAGQPIGLEVDAPAGITPATALVTTRIDGVPQLVDAPLALDASGRGLETLIAPATPGTWQIDVTVAGYPAAAILQPVHPIHPIQ